MRLRLVPRREAATAALVMLLSAGVGALGQGGGEGPEPVAAVAKAEKPVVAAPMPDVRLMASDGLARTALAVLRGIPAPSEVDYRVTALALRIAQRPREVGPDEEMLRLERDAWQSAGDEEAALELTRRIARAWPGDLVSLLRVLTARIRGLQDTDQRLAAYDKLLGPEGAGLDPAIRSRLALDAALIARETGDEAGFLARLTQATTLDASNKDAAVLYATYLLDRTQDPRERADLLGNIVLSDPTDSEAYTNLAMELFRRGAFEGAFRFLNDATQLIVASGMNLTPDEIFIRYVGTWLSEGAEACGKQLDAMMNVQRTYVFNIQRERERQGLDPAPEMEARLPAQFETLRLAMAFAAGDAEGLRKSVESLAATSAQQIKEIEDHEGASANLSEEQARDRIRQARTELVFDRLWAGYQIDEAERELELLIGEGKEAAAGVEEGKGEGEEKVEGGGLGAEAIERFRAFIAVRRGDIDGGIARLVALDASDLVAGLGVAIGLEAAGRREEAVRAYAKLALGNATSAIGAAARRRVEELLGRPLAKTPEAAALEAWSSGFAPWLDAMSEGPRRYMSLTARHVRPQIDIFDRVEVQVTLRNISRWPLALGPDSAINSRFLLTPRVTVKGVESREMALPEVTNLDRKLRLGPGEQVSVVVWASRGPVGTLASLTATKATKIRWRVMQGYRMDRGKGIVPGQLSISTETDLLSVYTLAERTEAEVVEGIRTGEGRAFLEAVTVAGGMGAARKVGESKESNLERRRAFADALAERLPSLNEYERVWALATAIPGGMFHAGAGLIDATRGDDSPLVKALLLVAPYRSVDVIDIPDLTHDADPDVAAMARLVKSQLDRSAPAAP